MKNRRLFPLNTAEADSVNILIVFFLLKKNKFLFIQNNFSIMTFYREKYSVPPKPENMLTI